MPKVSIIVPVYNKENYISRCIESIQNQTMTDWELILVDDCSIDDSYSVMTQYADQDKRIRLLRHTENHGPMIARRWGDMTARGDCITYCDGDDYLPKNALETLYNEAIRTDADIVSGDYIYVTTNGKEVCCRSELRYGATTAGVLRSLLRNEYKHTLCGKLFKRPLLQDFDYQIYEHATNGEDGILFYQLLVNTNSMAHINTNVYYYVQNSQSSTQLRYCENAIRSICLSWKVQKDIIKKIPELEQELNKRLTNRLCEFYVQGYNKDARLAYYIKEYGLGRYVSPSYILRYLDYILISKIFIRRCLLWLH